MATSFNDIYKKFSTIRPSQYLASLDEDTFNELMELYINRSASLEFKQCTKDLSDITTVEDDPTLTYPQFNEDLTDEEQWILAYGIFVSYLDSKLYEEKLFRASISTKDYKESSHAALLSELLDLHKYARSQLENYRRDYTYNDFEAYY